MQDVCVWSMCFFKLTGNEPRFFGFAEFLTALALMVLVWTTTDARYRFRVRTAPLPMQRLTFAVVVAVGVLALLTDLWRAQRWYVLEGNVLTPSGWQGLLGAVLLVAFLVWTWFAFMRPPHYSRLTAKHFATALYEAILRGQPEELAVVADELGGSMSALVEHAPTSAEAHQIWENGSKLSPVAGYGNDIFLMLADPRFVRALVDAAPHTAFQLFWQMAEKRRYPVAVRTFARNFVVAAINNEQSFLYRETEAYESGLLGQLKPLTTVMFSKYEMVSALHSLLDPGLTESWNWNQRQLKAYGRLVVLAMKAYVSDGYLKSHSTILYRACDAVANATFDLYTLNGVPAIEVNSDPWGRLSVAVRILMNCIEVLDGAGEPLQIKLRNRQSDPAWSHSVYDTLAKAICELIFHASQVRGPRNTCWSIQHNTVWSPLKNLDGPAGKVIMHKVRRLLYEDIIGDMNRFPNYKAAALLAFCLNVLGHRPNLRRDYGRHFNGLKCLIIEWLKKNFVRLYASHPAVAEHCLLDDVSYDPLRRRILFARPGRLGQKKPRYSYLQLD